jgi:hypothetical protein
MLFETQLAAINSAPIFMLKFYVMHPYEPQTIALQSPTVTSDELYQYIDVLKSKFETVNDSVRIPILKVKPEMDENWPKMFDFFQTFEPLVDPKTVEGL